MENFNKTILEIEIKTNDDINQGQFWSNWSMILMI